MLRWPDLVVMGLFFATFLFIGVIFARRNRSAETYFLAGRNLPGWLVGFSVMATIVSALTFLALPGFTYKENWRYFNNNLGYLLAMVPTVVLFMPFYRTTGVSSAYEYLEKRFGAWARVYAAGVFVLWMTCRMAIILYAVSLPLGTMVRFELPWIILVFGIIATAYTVAGGLEAVIWTDLLQTVAMFIGAIICLPLLLSMMPGGWQQIVSEAYADGKFSLGSTSLNLNEKTVWVMAMLSLFTWLHWCCQDQTMIQRYLAPRSRREARRALILGSLLTFPVWTYFMFVGTALYVFYKVHPDPQLSGIVEVPEQILPYFVLKYVPSGLAGFVICGLVAAAMSTLDSGINAVASTLTNDFYRRLNRAQSEERHYLRVGRAISCLLGAFMILGALVIHYTNTRTLQDLQFLIQSVSGGGLLALTLLGMLTVRVDNRVAIISVAIGLAMVLAWLGVDSPWGRQWFPGISQRLPDKFWMHVLVNVFVFTLGYGLSFLLGNRKREQLKNLTIWSMEESSSESDFKRP